MKKRQRAACTIAGCDRAVAARGLCNAHYKRWRHGGAVVAAPLRTRHKCTITGCGRWVHGDGLCQSHLMRWHKYGNPTATPLHDSPGSVKGRVCHIEGCGRPVAGRGFCAAHLARSKIMPDRLYEPMRQACGALLAFLREAMQTESDDCLYCPAGDRGKYIKVTIAGRQRYAHNVICEWEHGKPPAKRRHAAHNCGNKGCLNRRHLRWATPKENEADKERHGTKARGERNGHAKLTEAAARSILSDKRSLREIADQHGVSIATVWCIKRRINWKHID